MREELSENALKKKLTERSREKLLQLHEPVFNNLDLSGWDLSGLDLRWADFHNCILEQTDFHGSDLSNACFRDAKLKGADFRGCVLHGTDLRWDDLRGIHIEGADLYAAQLEGSQTEGIVDDENTRFFRMECPEIGAFVGYKKCFNNTLVQLLIPADAKRVMATTRAGRCNKAKVLSIKTFDGEQSFEETCALADPNFIYRRGCWVHVDPFDENRWLESTPGIYFWLTPEEALAY